MRAKLLCVLVLLFAFAVAAPAAPFSPPGYTLQVLPGEAYALSNTGWVVGTLTDTSGDSAAYRWRAGQTEILPDFGTGHFRGSRALAVNDLGQVVGTAGVFGERQFSGYSPAVLFGAGEPQILGVVSGVDGNANDINNAGQIAGTGWHDNLLFGAFVWDGQIHALPSLPGLGGATQALAINESGVVAGWEQPLVSVADEGPTAIIWINGTPRALTAHGTVSSQSLDINDTGIAVGWIGPPVGPYQSPPSMAPVSWDTAKGGAAVPLAPGVLGTATAINGAGIAVGDSQSGFALLYGGGQAFRLQNLVLRLDGWSIVRATDINDAGQILVRAVRNGNAVSLLLTPVPARYVPNGGR